MDSSVYEHFLLIAKTQSYTKAADILGKEESVLSRQMSRLERALGIKLFERRSRSIVLTPAAAALEHGLRAACDSYHAGLEKAKDIDLGLSGTITIGILTNHLLPNRVVTKLNEFKQNFPDVRIQIEAYPLNISKKKLINEELDFFFGATLDFQDDHWVRIIPEGYAACNAVISKSHPVLAKGVEKLSIADFRNEKLLIARELVQNTDIFLSRINSVCLSLGFMPAYVSVPDHAMAFVMVQMQDGFMIIDDTHILSGSVGITQIHLPELSQLSLGFIYKKDVEGCRAIFAEFMLDQGSEA